MTWHIEMEGLGGIIELVFSEELDTRELRDSTNAVMAQMEKTESRRILINCLALERFPAASAVQQLPDYYAARGIDTDVKIGLVNSGDALGREISQYYKLAAKRRNYKVQLFDQRGDALQWLE